MIFSLGSEDKACIVKLFYRFLSVFQLYCGDVLKQVTLVFHRILVIYMYYVCILFSSLPGELSFYIHVQPSADNYTVAVDENSCYDWDN